MIDRIFKLIGYDFCWRFTKLPDSYELIIWHKQKSLEEPFYQDQHYDPDELLFRFQNYLLRENKNFRSEQVKARETYLKKHQGENRYNEPYYL